MFSPKALKDVILQKEKNNKTEQLVVEIEKHLKPVYDAKKQLIGVHTSAEGVGWLSEENGLNILRVKGTQIEMGYQHGYLLAVQIQEPRGNPPEHIYKYWSNYIDEEQIEKFAPGLAPIVKAITAPWVEEAVIADRIPDDVFRSLIGLCAGYQHRITQMIEEGHEFKLNKLLTKFDYIRGYIQPDICNILINNTIGGKSLAKYILRDDGIYTPEEPIGNLGCTSVGFLTGKTKDGDLLMGCNFDYDPLAGLWEKNLTLIHFDPLSETEGDEKPQRFLTVSTAGTHTGGLLGVNENGIAFRVHNNFTGKTDRKFHRRCWKHGQPLLNFGDYILRKVKDVEGLLDLEKAIWSVKKGINCEGRVSDSPASGWTFIVAQNKSSDKGKIQVRETNFKQHRTAAIPAKYLASRWKRRNRYAFFSDLPDIKLADIEATWQTNYYTNPRMRKTDIFDRRTGQFDRLNRFFRMGEQVRARYTAGDITWKNIADMLADNHNTFVGNKERLNVGTVASVTTVTSIIFSIKQRDIELPEVKVYVASEKNKKKKTTPTSWWEYHEYNLDDFNDEDRKNYGKTTGYSGKNPSELYTKAAEKLYEAYTYYTFTESNDFDDFEMLKKVQTIEKVYTTANAHKKMDPIVPFIIGRVYCNIMKANLAAGLYKLAEKYKREALKRFEECLECKYLFDPHLITLARVYYVRLASTMVDPSIVKRRQEMIAELKKDDIWFNDIIMTPELKQAFKPFLKNWWHRGDKLQYIRDTRLEQVVENIIDDQVYDLDDLESSIYFDGPDPLLYDYQSRI
ncbi:MAG: hypothetical protein JW737_04630 [Acidobacteria bacterium]|nr:hypothetical protein [Acidobacteriota bacterium]